MTPRFPPPQPPRRRAPFLLVVGAVFAGAATASALSGRGQLALFLATLAAAAVLTVAEAFARKEDHP